MLWRRKEEDGFGEMVRSFVLQWEKGEWAHEIKVSLPIGRNVVNQRDYSVVGVSDFLPLKVSSDTRASA